MLILTSSLKMGTALGYFLANCLYFCLVCAPDDVESHCTNIAMIDLDLEPRTLNVEHAQDI